MMIVYIPSDVYPLTFPTILKFLIQMMKWFTNQLCIGVNYRSDWEHFHMFHKSLHFFHYFTFTWLKYPGYSILQSFHWPNIPKLEWPRTFFLFLFNIFSIVFENFSHLIIIITCLGTLLISARQWKQVLTQQTFKILRATMEIYFTHIPYITIMIFIHCGRNEKLGAERDGQKINIK